MSYRSLPLRSEEAAPRSLSYSTRVVLAALLHAASLVLGRVAVRLAAVAVAPRLAELAPQVVEFHAEAGAPEGALYVDGELVGHLSGITRL